MLAGARKEKVSDKWSQNCTGRPRRWSFVGESTLPSLVIVIISSLITQRRQEGRLKAGFTPCSKHL